MRHFEEWLAFLAAQLPDPVNQEENADGTVVFTGGDPGQVIAILSGASITVYEFAVNRDATVGTMTLAPRRIGVVFWRRARNNATIRAVSALIEAARESRLSKFTACVQCERLTAPERMYNDEICESCASLHQ